MMEDDVLLLLIAAQVAATPAPVTPARNLDNFLRLNMLMSACPTTVSPFVRVAVDDIVAASSPEVRAKVTQVRDAGRYELRLTSQQCRLMLPSAIAEARLP
jgi:preprotein translocase subunit SecB